VQPVPVVQRQLDGRFPRAAGAGWRRLSGGRGLGAEQLGLDLARSPGVDGHLVEGRAGRGKDDGGHEPLDQWRGREHDRRSGGAVAEVQGQLRAEHSAAEVHHDEHTLGGRDLVDGFPDPDRVGAGDVAVESGGDGDRRRRTSDHLERELHRCLGQLAAVGDHDDPDPGAWCVRAGSFRLAGCSGRAHGASANAEAAASISSAAEVAPGSWWPALRSPR
jgi:hypothetical protein